ncbi:MAG: hypothetical protein WCH10_05785 [bacterium]
MKKDTRFNSDDLGWVVMSVGMAIGGGIVFLPVKVGLEGLWVFLLSSAIAYPAMYLFQRLFINTLVASKECTDYPGVISGYLGKNWGFVLGTLYFIMMVIWIFVYSTVVTNDSASFARTFGWTKTLLSNNPFYGLALVIFLVAVASCGEKYLFRIATGLVLTKLLVIVFLGVSFIPAWSLKNIASVPSIRELITKTIVMLPFTLTSILFIQSLSPMVISYRSKGQSVEVAHYRAMRAMTIAYCVLFVTVFFYAISFTLATNREIAVAAYYANISALAMVASTITGQDVQSVAVMSLSLILDIFAVFTAFLTCYQGFREACEGIAMNLLSRVMPENNINKKVVALGVLLFTIIVPWGAIALNLPVLSYTLVCSPIFGLVGCLIPAYLVYRVPSLHKYKGLGLKIIIATGIMLIISPFLSF